MVDAVNLKPEPTHDSGQSLPPLAPQARTAVRNFAREHGLTDREHEILELIVRGAVSAEELGTVLGLSRHTVQNHCKNIFRRTHANSKTLVLSRLIRFVASS